MRMAFDTILSDYVDAHTAAKSGGFEPYRYECACCWEEVRICAVDSKDQATHFRHHHGNNNVECENYYGNRSTIIRNALSRRNVRDKIEFYFSYFTKMFSVGVKFNAEEISEYERNGYSFQVRSTYSGTPIISIPIKNNRFLPDVFELISINNFAWEYYISSTNNIKPSKYEVFHKDAKNYLYPSFFKNRIDDDFNNYHSKLICTEILYTNTPYIIVFPYSDPALTFLDGSITGAIINFKTMNRDFTAIPVTFTQKLPHVVKQLEVWEYKLETNENVTLLWPPSSRDDNSFLIRKESAIVFTSFDLQAHGNTNAHFSDIYKIGNGLSKILISGQKKIYKKNAELVLNKNDDSLEKYCDIELVQKKAKTYIAHDENAYLFNRTGITRIGIGVTIPITDSCIVKHYSFGYLDCIILSPDNHNELDSISLIEDIVKNYKRMEYLVWTDFESLDLSKVAFDYLETCKKTGMINSAVKRYIKEGRI